MRTILAVTLALLTGASAPALRADETTPGSVTLPLADYDRLVERAARPPKRPEAPPVAAVLARAEARVTVEGGLARGTFRLEGEVYAAGPVRLPLFAAGSLLLDARTANGRVPLTVDGGGLQAMLSGPGAFTLNVDFAAPVETEPGRASFTLPVPRAGSVRATIEVPGEPAGLGLEGGSVTRLLARDGRRVIEATLERDRPARVFWSARDSAPAAQREARVLSDVKTLVTLGEAELLAAALVDVTVVEGEPASFVLDLPAGFEVTGASGSTLDTTADAPGALTLNVREPGKRRHQFLVSLARATEGGSYQAAAPIVALRGAQRETGEVGVLGVGTLDLAAAESGTLRRMDTSEAGPALRSLARDPLLAAFRYHRRAGEAPALALDVKRFEAAAVLAALAERVVATTLVTAEGRALTEIRLTVRNHAQPFLKVVLPEGATLLSADVAGQGVKPAQGDGGTRVPMLRPGFRPGGTYEMSFVYLLPGAPMGKRGEAQISLPRLDLPVERLDWELFLPDRYRVKRFEGNALRDVEISDGIEYGVEGGVAGGVHGGVPGGVVGGVLGGTRDVLAGPTDSTVAGHATDESGQPLPGITVTLTGADGAARHAVTRSDGGYVFSGLPRGRYKVRFDLPGLTSVERTAQVTSGHAQADAVMKVGSLQEVVEVVADSPAIQQSSADSRRKREEAQASAPSANVFSLQRRVAGVLPVRVDVPHKGTSFRFIRPLVLDEETTLRFRYKAR